MRVWAGISPQYFAYQDAKRTNIKTAVVTGAGGFLGTRVVSCLKLQGWKVMEALHGTILIDGNVYSFDLNTPETIKNLKVLAHIDAIIHLGCKVGWNGEKNGDLRAANVDATCELAKIAVEKNAKIIFASAAIVCGSKTSLINSDSHLHPDTPYAESKLEAERMIMKAKTNHCILRFCGLWGERGPEHLMLNSAINKALDGKAPTIYGSGRAVRNYLYVMDAAEIVIDSLNEQKQGTYLVGGAERLSISEMLKKVCQVFLPGQVPQHVEHEEALDQIIESTYTILNRMTFHERLIAIKKGLTY